MAAGGKLIVRIHSGKNLPNADIGGLSDPYCIIKLDGSEIGRTTTVMDNLNPIWNHDLIINLKESSKEILLDVYDEDRFRIDDYLGKIKLSVPEILSGVVFQQQEVPLCSKKGAIIAGASIVISARLETDRSFSFANEMTASMEKVGGYSAQFTILAIHNLSVNSSAIIKLTVSDLPPYKTTNKPTRNGCWVEVWRLAGILPGSEMSVDVLSSGKPDAKIIASGHHIFREQQLKSDPSEFKIKLVSASASAPYLSLHGIFYQPCPEGETGAISYVVHRSKFVGLITSTRQKGGEASWPCFDLELSQVKEVFGSEKQGWNRAYDAAQKIYGRGPACEAVRLTVRSQHTAIYRARGNDISGAILNGDQFFQLLDFGFRRGKPRYYTYVIANDGHMRFSETGANFKDIMSKHAMHSNCAEDVFYSGEFCLVKNLETGRFCLAIDNNSGTFAPSKDALLKVQQVMESNFPNMEISAISFDDPRFKETKARMTAMCERATASDWGGTD